MMLPAFRIASTSAQGELSRYPAIPLLLAATLAAGAGFAIPTLLLPGRLVLTPLRGGTLGLAWRAGVEPAAAVQQQAADVLAGLLLGIAGLTLVVAIVTLLILSLARESERSAELRVRRAMGAGRRILLGSAMLEGTAVAVAGLAGGALLGAIVTAARSGWPGEIGQPAIGRVTLAAVLLLIVVLIGVTFPVLFPRRRIGEAEPRSPTPLTPSALQIGASLIALSMGALLGRHAGIMDSTAAIPVDGVVHAITLADTAPAERSQLYGALLERLDARGAEASIGAPGGVLGLGQVGTVTTDCGRCSEGGLPIRWRVKAATHHLVSADTFQMLGQKVVEGRGITRDDTWGSRRVAVINRSLAAREFQNGEPLGRGIRVVDDGDVWSTVVGVVDDVPAIGLGAGTQPAYRVYLSVLQHPPASADLLIARRDEPAVAGAAADSGFGPGALDPTPIRVAALVSAQMAPLRWFAAQFGLQGWAMLAIATVGAYAATRLWVLSLLGELGLRRAIGARRRQVIAYVLSRSAGVAVAGIALGVWFGQATWNILADLVPGLDPWDVTLVLRLGGLLMLAALAGALPPAWRASRSTPASLLGAS